MREPKIRFGLILTTVFIAAFFFFPNRPPLPEGGELLSSHETYEPARQIDGTIEAGETFFDIFKRNNLNQGDLFQINRASASTGRGISRLQKGQPYKMKLDSSDKVLFLSYQRDDWSSINITHTGADYVSSLVPIEYERRIKTLKGTITSNLVNALNSDLLSLMLSDIFAWDIDFTTDLRVGDTFEMAVQELLIEGKFMRYGKITTARFVNNGKAHRAYLFDDGSGADYYDEAGGSMRKSLLKAPLSYRRISSRFTHKRFHPILKKYRPHLGVDYSAARGTPVSSVGDGTIKFAARKGANGKLVIVKHAGGYETSYGHLHRISRGIRRGVRVKQGQVIGQVGSTGRSTGPHLDYRIKKNGRFVNPLTLRLPKKKGIDKTMMDGFMDVVQQADALLMGDDVRLARTPATDTQPPAN